MPRYWRFLHPIANFIYDRQKRGKFACKSKKGLFIPLDDSLSKFGRFCANGGIGNFARRKKYNRIHGHSPIETFLEERIEKMATIEKNKAILEAETLYMGGTGFKTISAKLGVKLKTLYGWAYRGDWFGKLERYRDEVRRATYTKLVDMGVSSTKNQLTGNLIVSQIVGEALSDLYAEIKADAGTDKYRSRLEEIAAWTNILSKTSIIYKNIVPDPGDKTTEKLVAEVQEINRNLCRDR